MNHVQLAFGDGAVVTQTVLDWHAHFVRPCLPCLDFAGYAPAFAGAICVLVEVVMKNITDLQVLGLMQGDHLWLLYAVSTSPLRKMICLPDWWKNLYSFLSTCLPCLTRPQSPSM